MAGCLFRDQDRQLCLSVGFTATAGPGEIFRAVVWSQRHQSWSDPASVVFAGYIETRELVARERAAQWTAARLADWDDPTVPLRSRYFPASAVPHCHCRPNGLAPGTYAYDSTAVRICTRCGGRRPERATTALEMLQKLHFGCALLVALAVISCGCAFDQDGLLQAPGVGVRVSDEQLCVFRYGASTWDEVRATFGPASFCQQFTSVGLLIYEFQDPARQIDEEVTFSFRRCGESSPFVLDRVSRVELGAHRGVLYVPACLGTPGQLC
jgi:hypothetical protein